MLLSHWTLIIIVIIIKTQVLIISTEWILIDIYIHIYIHTHISCPYWHCLCNYINFLKKWTLYSISTLRHVSLVRWSTSFFFLHMKGWDDNKKNEIKRCMLKLKCGLRDVMQVYNCGNSAIKYNTLWVLFCFYWWDKLKPHIWGRAKDTCWPQTTPEINDLLRMEIFVDWVFKCTLKQPKHMCVFPCGSSKVKQQSGTLVPVWEHSVGLLLLICIISYTWT